MVHPNLNDDQPALRQFFSILIPSKVMSVFCAPASTAITESLLPPRTRPIESGPLRTAPKQQWIFFYFLSNKQTNLIHQTEINIVQNAMYVWRVESAWKLSRWWWAEHPAGTVPCGSNACNLCIQLLRSTFLLPLHSSQKYISPRLPVNIF